MNRLFNVIIASLILIFTLPLFIIIGILIKITSKGPVFYISKRVGKDMKVFLFYKFRTMEMNAENKLNEYQNIYKSDVFYKIDNDPRITKIGEFLRKTNLDELPQLFNVIKGDMNLVGNRPLPVYEAKALIKMGKTKRFEAPAGISGLWQIKRRGQENMSESERIKLDEFYVDKRNLKFDVIILLGTFTSFKQKTNC